jgi:hypothetical protein
MGNRQTDRQTHKHTRNTRVVYPDPRYFWKLDPDPIRVESWIQICIREKLDPDPDAHNGGLKAQNGALEGLSCKPAVTDYHHF